MIAMVAAITDNNVIGHHGAIPWYMPADLRYFKTITMGHTVVMGRKTFESIITVLGKPLPGRHNVVLTRDPRFTFPGVAVVRSIEAALEQFPDAMIIGGASLYEQFMPHASRLIMTEVHTALEGDTFFPAIDANIWKETLREDYTADEKNQYDYSFVTYDRIK